MSGTGIRIATTTLLALIGLCGCRVSTDSGDKNVDIRTPLGSISVHQGNTDPRETGLSLYPGAQLKKDHEDRDGSANVDISSSFFGLKVVALKYQSNDAVDKVREYYRKEMSKYGNVVDCTGGVTLRFHRHEHDAEVTCQDGSGHEYREALKVGTEYNQRIVAIRPSAGGTEFALVYVRAFDDKTTM